MDSQKITLLANKFINGTATNDEKEQIHNWYDEWQDDEEQITQQDENIESARLKILNKIIEKMDKDPIPVTPVMAMKKHGWGRIAAAAAILIMLLGGSYLLWNKSFDKNEFVKNTIPVKDIAAPKTTKATITLANGQTVLLDSINNGLLATQGNVNVTKTADGQIIYTGSGSSPQGEAGVRYNTLTNPRGSTVINLTLSDGTKVWLNSESSLKYPIAFAGNERKVEITGEAYFEVSKDARKKFLVDAKGVITEVLGTHFNVNSYSDEASTKITLLEGSVKVTSGTATDLLKPGQQAQCFYPPLGNGGKCGSLKVLTGINTDEVMAWKEGKFQFGEKADVASIMRQIARWYDLEVEYRGTINEHIGGGISRNVNASKVLKMLEATGVVKFRIEGQKVIVFP